MSFVGDDSTYEIQQRDLRRIMAMYENETTTTDNQPRSDSVVVSVSDCNLRDKLRRSNGH